ncbi:MAG: ABC transporter substrate-binding protein [Bacteroidota bacterium]
MSGQIENIKIDKPKSEVDLFPHKVVPQLARHFRVSYHGNYKVVKTDATFYPNGEEEEGEIRQDVLVLVQRGSSPPHLHGELEKATIIEIPVKTAAVNIQHAESFLRELGLEHHINAIGGLYSYDHNMRNKAISGEIGQIGYSWHSPPNIEVLLQRQPDVFLMTLASMDHTTSLEKCRQVGIPTVAVFDWAEQAYLARAEWLKFYSLFFNAEEDANRVFHHIEERINSLKALTSDLPERESAIWGFYTSKQRWAMQISSFQAQYMQDAGLENILAQNTPANANGRQTLNTEELLLKGKEAKHWIIGDIHAGPLPQEDLMESFAAWRSGHLYHNMTRMDSKNNASDWYATAIVRPDTVLADLIKLTHPQLLADYSPVFLGHYDKHIQGPSSTEPESHSK